MYIELVKYPDVFLRSESKTVPFPLDDKTERLIKYMSRAMYQHHGIGLAAIQVGYQLRMFVMDCKRRSEEKPQVFINPEIVIKIKRINNVILKGVYLHQANRGEVKVDTLESL